ncbi:hypothetical protein PsYK624_164660 [Phanerochaete sordida]|uniref:Uncharacterized protein n=1 Tax=Phanerochaete sordida TaxID=48140 RepID=A0A9P3GSQ9_9APHY|nr:hypothetical protein PsYK624_164660 [Phanerochaete sordida]
MKSKHPDDAEAAGQPMPATQQGEAAHAAPSVTVPGIAASRMRQVPLTAPFQPFPGDGPPSRSNRSSSSASSEYGLGLFDDYSRGASPSSWQSHHSRASSLDSRSLSHYEGSDRDGAESVASDYPPSSRATSASVDPDFPFVPSRAPSEAGDGEYLPEGDARGRHDVMKQPGHGSAPMLPPGFLLDSLPPHDTSQAYYQIQPSPSSFDQPYIVIVNERPPSVPEAPPHEQISIAYDTHEAWKTGLPPMYAEQARPAPEPASSSFPYIWDDPPPFAPNPFFEVAATAPQRPSGSRASADGPQHTYRPRPQRGRPLKRTADSGARDKHVSLPRRSRSPRSRDASGASRRPSFDEAQLGVRAYPGAVGANGRGPSQVLPGYFKTGEFDRDYDQMAAANLELLRQCAQLNIPVDLHAPIPQRAGAMGPPQHFPGHILAHGPGPSHYDAPPPSRTASGLGAYPAGPPYEAPDGLFAYPFVGSRRSSCAHASTGGSASASASRESLPLTSDAERSSSSRDSPASTGAIADARTPYVHLLHPPYDANNDWLPSLEAAASSMIKGWQDEGAAAAVGGAPAPGESRSPADDRTPKKPRRAAADRSWPLAANGPTQGLVAQDAFAPFDDLPHLGWRDEFHPAAVPGLPHDGAGNDWPAPSNAATNHSAPIDEAHTAAQAVHPPSDDGPNSGPGWRDELYPAAVPVLPHDSASNDWLAPSNAATNYTAPIPETHTAAQPAPPPPDDTTPRKPNYQPARDFWPVGARRLTRNPSGPVPGLSSSPIQWHDQICTAPDQADAGSHPPDNGPYHARNKHELGFVLLAGSAQVHPRNAPLDTSALRHGQPVGDALAASSAAQIDVSGVEDGSSERDLLLYGEWIVE